PPIPTLFTKQWSSKNGLISNEITSSVQTKSGFLWITSYHGLMRFDGNDVDVFNQNNTPILKTGAFEKSYEDAQGTLWFTSQSNGIIQFKDNTFKSFPSIANKKLQSVHCLLIVNENTVWVGTTNEGLYLVKNDIVQSVGDSLMQDFTILDIVNDKKNNIWVATDGNGLIKYDGKSLQQFTTSDGLKSNFVNALAVTPHGDILVGTSSGLNVISNNNVTSFASMDDIQINCITIDPQQRAWIGTDIGLTRIFLPENKIETTSDENDFPYSQITDVSIDEEGNYWLSTTRNGLIQIIDRGITNYRSVQNLPLKTVSRIGYGPEQSIIIASENGELIKQENGEFKQLPIKKNLKGTIINDIVTDSKSNIWIGTRHGILKISPDGKEAWLTTADGLPSNDISRIIEDSSGAMWFATQSKGLVKFQNGQCTDVYNTINGLHSNFIKSIITDDNGTLYIGTNGGGLSILNNEGKIETWHIMSNDKDVLIYNIHKDQRKQLWLTTNFGLYNFDGKAFKDIQLKTPLPGASFYDWIEDKKGNIWVTSNAGVISMQRSHVLQYMAGKTSSVDVKLFEVDDGILSKEISATKSLLTSEGIWIPAPNGITVINPDRIIVDESIPPVYIKSLKTDKITFSPDSKIIIKPGNSRYTLNFTTPEVAAHAHIQYKYKLDKVDRFWVSAGANHQIEYTNLDPGTYTFQVIASINGNSWTKIPASITFTVSPYAYQTWWFMVLMILLGALILFLIYKWRVRFIENANFELRKVNGELDRFVYSASHDLRSPLSSMMGLIALARREDPGLAHSYIVKIEDCVKLLDKLIRDIIDFSSNSRAKKIIEQIDFHSLIDESVKTHQFMIGFNEIKWNVIINASHAFYSDSRRIKIIMSNLISNSIKYRNPNAAEPVVEISISAQKSHCDISVADNGIGIPAEHIDNIFDMFYRAHSTSQGSGLGLYIVRETIQKLHGTILVNSESDKGTTFKISLPTLKTNHPKARISWEKWSYLRHPRRNSANSILA
ncbi:MAG TPA: two-component regulator propeller domain-containing protein, partial [Cyclobacteriaceae bacterium]|nr:two-component regulator propeller domain-containing protein [Cyclobacteriaceae bacterium]